MIEFENKHTSMILVSDQYDTRHKSEIINNKSEIRNHKTKIQNQESEIQDIVETSDISDKRRQSKEEVYKRMNWR